MFIRSHTHHLLFAFWCCSHLVFVCVFFSSLSLHSYIHTNTRSHTERNREQEEETYTNTHTHETKMSMFSLLQRCHAKNVFLVRGRGIFTKKHNKIFPRHSFVWTNGKYMRDACGVPNNTRKMKLDDKSMRKFERKKAFCRNAYRKPLGCFDKNTNFKLHFNLWDLSVGSLIFFFFLSLHLHPVCVSYIQYILSHSHRIQCRASSIWHICA